MNRLASVILVVLLAGCSSGDHEELKTWMREQSKDMKGRIAPLPEMKPYEAISYGVSDRVDPFKQAKLEPEQKKGGGGIRPDFNRPREALEAYPLESLKYVGYLQRRAMSYGIILADSAVHQVKIGNYMGRDFGIVTNITEGEITLRELIQDSSGDWIERSSTLQLQEQEATK